MLDHRGSLSSRRRDLVFGGSLLLAGALPFHWLLVRSGLPSLWKEAGLAVLLLLALPDAPRILRSRTHRLAFAFMWLACFSGLLNGRLGPYDLAPYLLYPALLLVIPIGASSLRRLQLLGVVLVTGAAVNAVVAVASQVFQAHLVESTSIIAATSGGIFRPGSFAGGSVVTATFLGPLAGMAWTTFLSTPLKTRTRSTNVFMAMAVATITAGAFATLARAVVLGIAAGVVSGLAIRHRREGRIPKLAVLLLVTGALSLPFVIHALNMADERSVAQRYNIFNPMADRANAVRVDRWVAAIAMGFERPLLGHGPGSTGRAQVVATMGTGTVYTPDSMELALSESNVTKILAELGLFSLIIGAALCASALYDLWQAPGDGGAEQVRAALTGLIAAAVAHGLVFPSMESYLAAAIFWGALGAVFTIVSVRGGGRYLGGCNHPLRQRNG